MKRNRNTRTSIILVAAILVVINLIGVNWFGRIDLTDDKVYSLSTASIELVENLEDPVTVRAYFSDTVPALATTRRMVRDKLDEYRAYGGANFQYEFISPETDEARQEAEQSGIPPMQVQVLEEDGASVKNAYMGLVLEYGDQKETIPVVQNVSSLEYDVTVAVRKLSSEVLPTVGFLGGVGSPSLNEGLATLQRLLDRIYTVEEVMVSDGVLSPHPDVLFIIAPTDTLRSDVLGAVDRYIMDGGRVGFLENRIAVDLQTGTADVGTTGLSTLLDVYGISIQDNLVRDERSAMIEVQGPFGFPMQVQYPLAPAADQFNGKSAVTSGLRTIVFPFVSSIETSDALPGVDVLPLVWSSAESDLMEGFFMIQPTPDQQVPDLSGGPYVLAASYSGVFPSAVDPQVRSQPTRLLAVGDGDFIDETGTRVGEDSYRFVLNAVDWLIQDESLSTIRIKNVQPRALGEVSDGARSWIKYFNILGPPLIVIVLGMVRWRFRRSRRIVLTNSTEEKTVDNDG